MCSRMNRCGVRAARQSQPGNGDCNCCCCCRCCTTGCGCGCEDTAPTATISMADYQPFILVPTTVFDSGDTDCGCGCGMDW